MIDEANKKVFIDRMQDHMTRLNDKLKAAMDKDKMMNLFDAMALEAIRLKINGWDQLKIADLREAIRVARAKEREEIGVHKATVKP
jgi:hypothetical protein